jgi:anti-sigma factor RsiW
VKHVQDDLTAYLDGALAPGARAKVDEHLALCAPCRAERDRLSATLALLGRLPPAPAPSPAFEARFEARLAAIRAEGRERRALFDGLRWRWLAPGLAAAAMAATAVVVARDGRAREVALADHLELIENYEAVASVGAIESADDVEVVAHLDEVEATP